MLRCLIAERKQNLETMMALWDVDAAVIHSWYEKFRIGRDG